MFATFGPVARVWMAKSGETGLSLGLAFVTVAERPDAVRACEYFHGFCYQYLVMRVEFAQCIGANRPRLALECPDDGEFVVLGPLLWATVKLPPVAPTATYVMIVISTSWELKESWKEELEGVKKDVLGSTLGARVFLAYDKCESPSQEGAVVK